MSANELVKRNISGMQVIKTLQLLLEGNFTMAELIEKLNQKEKESIFNNSVVSKYINTCRYCGIEIPKINNRYYVAKLPFGLDLEPKDYELLQLLQQTANEKLSGKLTKLFSNFIRKLNQYSNRDIIRVEKKNVKIAYEVFEKAVLEKRKIQLMLRTNVILDCIPLSITNYKNKPVFKVLHKEKERYVNVERVTGLQVLGNIITPEENLAKEVIFRIYGDLAKKYTLREHETEIARSMPNHITISNRGEDKDELLSRLLRYDKFCEIVSPQEYRDEFKMMLRNMLKNYGE